MIEELRPAGDVLQIGVGRKKVAAQIEAFHPQVHIVIEDDPILAKSLNKTIRCLVEPWQKALPTLGVFDVIYCEILEIGGLFSELPRIRYSDRDLEGFCKEAALSAPEALFRFLHELVHNGQITEEQLERMVKKFHLKGQVPKLKQSCRQMLACLKQCLLSHMRPGSRFGAALDDPMVAYDDPEFQALAADPYVEVRECKGGFVFEKI